MAEWNWLQAEQGIAKVAHNAMMADDWDDLPAGGIERAAWISVGKAVYEYLIEQKVMK
jgi:hypothetical protein